MGVFAAQMERGTSHDNIRKKRNMSGVVQKLVMANVLWCDENRPKSPCRPKSPSSTVHKIPHRPAT